VVNLTTNTSEKLRARFGKLLDQTDLKGSFPRISGRRGRPQILLFFFLSGLFHLYSQFGEAEGILFPTIVLPVDIVDFFIVGSHLSSTTIGLYGVA
jgi:hypothetical protein